MKKMLFIVLVLLLICPVGVHATSITADLTGSRSTFDNTLDATNGWNSGKDINGKDINGFEIRWDIIQNGDEYTYNYWISGDGDGDTDPLSYALSNFILEVTEGAEHGDFWDVTPLDQFDSEIYDSEIHGIKWDATGDPTTYHVSFTTLRDPVWSDFIAKDGTHSGPDGTEMAYARNTGFGTNPDDGTTDFKPWIAAPNGGTSIPDPAAVFLLGSACLIGFGGVRRKLIKK